MNGTTTYPHRHTLGRIDIFDLPDTLALSRDVALNIDVVQVAWPEFEEGVVSLQGRRMMGLIFGGNDVYRLSSVRLDRDDDPRRLLPSAYGCAAMRLKSTDRYRQPSTRSSISRITTRPDRISSTTSERVR